MVDKGCLWFLLHLFPYVPWWFLASTTFCLGVTNGFVWNRRWTFRAHAHGSARDQYSRFFLTNVVGLVLNLMLTKGFLIIFTGKLAFGDQNPDPKHTIIASICAIPFVTIWNFGAARLWTFKRR